MGSRGDDLTFEAIVVGMTTIKTGGLSVTFHVTYEQADEAFVALRKRQSKPVLLTIGVPE